MAAFNKYNTFTKDLANGVHQMCTNSGHVYKIALTNQAPSAAANTILSDVPQISATNGYTANGTTAGAVTHQNNTGTFKFILGTDPVFTASGGSMGPFQYAVLFNDSATTPNVRPLIGWWDYGSPVTLANGETFTVDLDQTNGILTIA